MWLAELLGRERGEKVQLKNASSSQWVCDPHIKVRVYTSLSWKSLRKFHQVPFQPNHFDCGIHTLWHLKHVLTFHEVQGKDCLSNGLSFTDNMAGKRLRLAQEILDDCGIWDFVYHYDMYLCDEIRIRNELQLMYETQ